jgi:hypothetical protein
MYIQPVVVAGAYVYSYLLKLLSVAAAVSIHRDSGRCVYLQHLLHVCVLPQLLKLPVFPAVDFVVIRYTEKRIGNECNSLPYVRQPEKA